VIARSVVLALFAALTPGAERAVELSVVDAISATAETRQDAALLAVYAWHESQGREAPPAQSWDARALVSCGAWQLRCAIHRDALADARTWLALVRSAGLAAVDSSPRRALRRAREAEAIVEAQRAP
jgi:hypothetical protein